jgi:hypothetical protein
MRLIFLLIFIKGSQELVLCQAYDLPQRINLVILTKNSPGSAVRSGFAEPEFVPVRIQKSLLSWQNNGYPFASFRFDSVRSDGSAADLTGRILPGPAILNGPVIIHGDSSLSPLLIARWIRFRKDEPFSVSAADRIPDLLESLPFSEQLRSSELEWFGNQAIVHVHLRKSGTNSLNGIIGFLPGQNSGRLMLTGNAEADFTNLLNRGFGLSLRWARFAASSQSLFLDLRAPALTYSGLSLSGQFELFRQDSLYFRQRSRAEIGIGAGGLWQIRFGLQSVNSSQNQPGIRIRQSAGSLVLGLGMESVSAGRIAPSRKFCHAVFLPGIKNIVRDGLGKKTTQNEIRIQGAAPLWHPPGRFWLRGSLDLGFMQSESITHSDQFRIGGLRSFRGFNENQFFTSSHALMGIQPQVLLDQKFLFSLFAEGLMYQTELKWSGLNAYRYALGFGMGAELESGPNLIQVSIAGGIMKGLMPGLGSSKIHFGYVARF